MKLKHILPVATIASVAAVVTPLITSCANNNAPNKWDYKKDGKYEAKFKPYSEKEEATEQEATEIYYTKISKKPSIYYDDMLCHLNSWLDQSVVEIRNAFAEFKISNINLVDLDTEYTTRTKAIEMTITTTYNFDFDYEQPGNEKVTETFNFTATINNLKYFVNWVSYQASHVFWFEPIVTQWDAEQQIAYLMSDDKWSLKASGEIYETTIDYDVNAENLYLYSSQIGILRRILSMSSPISHYLSELTLSE